MITRILAAVAAVALSASVAFAAEKPLKIGVSAGPYGDILRETAKLAEKEGLKAQIIEFTDWPQINEALQTGDIDANNFQHVPYLDNQIKQRGYKIVPVVPSVVVPTGLYSSKFKTAADIPAGTKIGIPNDPTNSARALFLLEQAGVLKLKPGTPISATLADIAENPRKVQIVELDAAQLPRSLDDLGAAVITLNYAVLAGLDPKTSLAIEGAESRWTLVWAVREDRKDDARIRRFIDLYRSQSIKEFVLAKFSGTIIPTW